MQVYHPTSFESEKEKNMYTNVVCDQISNHLLFLWRVGDDRICDLP
jgi:hypothetical protein